MDNQERIAILKKSLENKFLADSMKSKIRQKISELENESPKSGKTPILEKYKVDFESNRMKFEKYKDEMPSYAKGIDFMKPVKWKNPQNDFERQEIMMVTNYNDGNDAVMVELLNTTMNLRPISTVSISEIENIDESSVVDVEWSEGQKKYYTKKEIKSVTVKKNGKQQTYKASDVFNGANFVDKKEKGGEISSKADYYPVNSVLYIITKDGKMMKPDNGYWIKKDATPIFELGGITETIDASTQQFNVSRLEKGGELNNATAEQRQKVKVLDIEPNDSAVIDESRFNPKDKTFSWENMTTGQTGEGFRTEAEAYDSLIKFLTIRKNLIDFYYRVGYEDHPVAPNSLIEKDYGTEITKAQLLINRGKVKEAFNLIGRGEGFEPEQETLFNKYFSSWNKKSKKENPDGRKSNGNPIFDKAKEIRKPGEKWNDAVQRAKKILYP